MIVSYIDLVSLLSHDIYWRLQKKCVAFHFYVKMNQMHFIAQSQNGIPRNCSTKFFGLCFVFMSQHPIGPWWTAENIF